MAKNVSTEVADTRVLISRSGGFIVCKAPGQEFSRLSISFFKTGPEIEKRLIRFAFCALSFYLPTDQISSEQSKTGTNKCNDGWGSPAQGSLKSRGHPCRTIMLIIRVCILIFYDE